MRWLVFLFLPMLAFCFHREVLTHRRVKLNGGFRIEAGGEDLSTLTVVQLKDRCRALGLPVSGVKAELIKRVEQQDTGLTAKLMEDSRAGAARVKGKPSSEPVIDLKDTASAAHTKGKPPRGAAALPVELKETEADELDLFMSIGETVMREKNLGDTFMSESRRRIEANNHRTVTASVVSSSTDDPTRVAIETLLRSRADARTDRDFDKADSIRAELEGTYSVKLYDRDGRWQDSEGRVGFYQELHKAPTVKVVSSTSLTREQIQVLVDNRTKARRARNFQLADELRDELAESGVELFDRDDRWQSVDGKWEGSQSTDGGFQSGVY